jgi:CheY-like chemotaxis protein
MRVLVVEDEPLLAMMLEESLIDLGHQVVGRPPAPNTR